jgi:FKBP-type peptidyl-prolyl cis-trans isomerase
MYFLQINKIKNKRRMKFMKFPTATESFMMIPRMLATTAAALCLVGCDKPSQTSGDNKAVSTAPGTTATTNAPTSEMKTTASGLKYQVLKQGTGTVSPKATDTVKVHYHGTLLDGTVFDSSVQRGQPASFPLTGVIKCWTEGVQMMKVGGKSKLTCPSSLAYGDKGAPPTIKPGSTLIFEVELLEIVAAK